MTILFIDLVGSTSLAEQLDPEALHLIMDRYFAGCSAAIAAHGGVVEKFIGDAVMAVFGAVVGHEDDAVRAVASAAAALGSLAELTAELSGSHRLELSARCGVCSGEVVVTTSPDGEVRVTGDAVNTASRLQSAAAPGAILVCGGTRTLLRSRVRLAPVPPLRLKGKAEPVAAWVVTDPQPPAPGATPARAPLVGRDAELAELTHCYRRAVQDRQACLVTVLGGPGIGKSRLVREFAAGLAGEDAWVLTGHCSAYGPGLTYRPLTEMLRSFPGGWAALTRALRAGPGPGARAMQCLAGIAGPAAPQPASTPAGASGPAGVEEICWAVRHALSVLGRARPVVTIWEGLEAAEPTLLDLVEDAAAWLAGVPVMLVCVARSDLLDARPSWASGRPGALRLELGPLTDSQTASLIKELALTREVQAHADCDLNRLARRCDGNPLFAELMLDVVAATASPDEVPPTIAAVLGARLDQLPADERHMLEIAAALGPGFTREALFAVAGNDGVDQQETAELLGRLARRRLVDRAPSGRMRLAQSLLRDTAYSCTPKTRRDRWHSFLARWCASQPAADSPDGPLPFVHHVEVACRLRRELLQPLTGLHDLSSQAADTLIAEGNLALARNDLPAAATLFERARGLLAAGDARHLPVALRSSDCWVGLLDAARARSVLADAEAALPGDARGRTACALQRCIVDIRLGLAPTAAVTERAGLIAADLARDPADDLSWCRYHQLSAYLRLAAERAAAAEACLRLALSRARALADRYEEGRLLCAICEVALWTPTPVSAGLAFCDELARRFAANRALLVPVLVTRAHLTALAGDLAAARQTLATARSYVGDLHLDLADAAVMETSGLVASLGGDHAAAERHYRHALAALAKAGGPRHAPAIAAAVARELISQGRLPEATAALDSLDAPAGQSPRVRLCVTGLRALLASAAGDHPEAARIARAASKLSRDTDDPCLAGEALFDAARVLAHAGLPGPAVAAGRRALRRLEAKEAARPAAAVRAWLAAHSQVAAP